MKILFANNAEKSKNTIKCLKCGKIKLHEAKGLCKKCYNNQNLKQCLSCNENKPHAGKGLCKKCHQNNNFKKCILCSQLRPHAGKGYCRKCYFKQYFKVFESKKSKVLNECKICKKVFYYNLKKGKICWKCNLIICLHCGTTKPNSGKGLCGNCFLKQNLKICKKCNKIKPHAAKNLCRICYQQSRKSAI